MTRSSKRIRWRAAALSGVAALTLAACGGQGGSGSGDGTADPNGILKYGTFLVTGAGNHFDPTKSRAEAVDLLPMQLVYGTLLRTNASGALEPWMAQDVQIVDAHTVKIVLRPGVKFSDGASYDAEAVKTSLMRLHTQGKPSAQNYLLPGFQALTSVDVVDPLTVQAHLGQPLASDFETSLAGEAGAIQSPKQIAEDPGSIETKPVGAGPYKLTAFQPQQLISFRKNADFWDAAKWKLGGVDVVNTSAGAPMANGLVAGTTDMVSQVPVTSMDSLKGNFGTHVITSNIVDMMLCPTKPPLDNEAVRQAIQLGIDRQAFNTLLYAGKGQPAYSLVPENSPLFDPKIKDMVGYNPDKAKQILASAGLSNVSLDVYLVSSNNYGQQAEVIQAQLAKIGINVQVHSELDIYNGWIAAQKPGGLLTFLAGTEPGSYKLFDSFFTKGGSYAYCGSSAPDVMSLVNAAAALPTNDPQAVALYRQASLLVAQHAYTIPVLMNPTVFGWNTAKVGGTPTFVSTNGIPVPQLDSVYIKK